MWHPHIHLPFEIRTAIFSYLRYELPAPDLESAHEHDARRVMLWALTLTSRMWNQLATPLLYESFIPTLDSLPLIIRTVYKKPELGQYTRSLGLERIYHDPGLHQHSVDGIEKEFDEYWARIGKESDELEARLQKGAPIVAKAAKPFSVTSRQLEGGPLWYNYSTYAWEWAFLLLYYLPNLQYIDLACLGTHRDPLSILCRWLHAYAEECEWDKVCVPICLSRLTTFVQSRPDSRYNTSTYWPNGVMIMTGAPFLSSILCFPRLQRASVYCNNLGDGNLEFGPLGTREALRDANGEVVLDADVNVLPQYRAFFPLYQELPWPSTSLEILDLDYCFFDAQALLFLFERTPKLRILNIVVGPDPADRYGRLDYFRMDENLHAIDDLAAAFALLRDSLEELKIVLSSHDGGVGKGCFLGSDDDDLEPCGWIGDLSGFWRLRKLDFDWHFWSLPDEIELVDGRVARSGDFIPERLEFLRIRGENHHNPDGGWAEFEGPYEELRDSWKLPTFKKSTSLNIRPSTSENPNDE